MTDSIHDKVSRTATTDREIERAREEARKEMAHRCEIAGWEYLVRDLHARLRAAEDECRTLRAECEGWRRDEAFRRDYEARRMAALSAASSAAMAAFEGRTGAAQ